MRKRKRNKGQSEAAALQWGHCKQESALSKSAARASKLKARALKSWEGLVTRYTTTFRSFAAMTPADGSVCVVEIGSSTGACSLIFFERVGASKTLLCLDTSKELVAQCRSSESLPPALRECFLRCNVLMEPAEVLSRCARMLKANEKVETMLVSVDIGQR